MASRLGKYLKWLPDTNWPERGKTGRNFYVNLLRNIYGGCVKALPYNQKNRFFRFTHRKKGGAPFFCMETIEN